MVENVDAVWDNTHDEPNDNVECVLGDAGLQIVAFPGWWLFGGSGGILLIKHTSK